MAGDALERFCQDAGPAGCEKNPVETTGRRRRDDRARRCRHDPATNAAIDPEATGR